MQWNLRTSMDNAPLLPEFRKRTEEKREHQKKECTEGTNEVKSTGVFQVGTVLFSLGPQEALCWGWALRLRSGLPGQSSGNESQEQRRKECCRGGREGPHYRDRHQQA